MKARRRYILTLVSIFTVYVVAAKISLNIYPGGHVITVIWPPAGITLASLLLFGYKVTPAIFAASFVVSSTQNATPLAALGFATANTVEPLLGAFLLKLRNQFDYSLERVRDVIRFIVLAAIISTAVGATLGVVVLLAAGFIHTSAAGMSWTEWWISDMLGDLVVAPFILVWRYHGLRVLRKNVRSLVKAILLLACLTLVTMVAFRGFTSIGIKPFILAYLVFPLLVWLSLRFRQLGSVTAVLLVSLVATFGTIMTFRYDNAQTITGQLLRVQTFLATTGATFMIIAAGVLERDANYVRRLELAAKTAQLARQKARLQALSQAKDDFITIASHQLKTPPTVIKQYAGMLLENRGGAITSKQRDMLRHVYDANEKQLRVIRDILNVAQVDTGNVVLHKEDVDLVALIQEVVDDKAGMFAEHKQSPTFIHARGSCHVNADRVKLYTVLDNIVDNASKYSPDGTAIEIKLTKYKSQIITAVKDNGIGFSGEDSLQLFRKFSRIGNGPAAFTGGTGIGLYWAKKVIDLHGGTITAKSKLGRGSTFSISLPAAKPYPGFEKETPAVS